MKHNQKIPRILSLGGLAVMLLAILFFGLNPKGFSFTNRVDWVQNQAGIHFRKYGMAYANIFIERTEADRFQPIDFTVEIALKIEQPHEDKFKFIFVFHNGQDRNQLLMAQWGSSIIFMNGDDYANKRRSKRLSVDSTRLPTGPLLLTLTTGSQGTKLYCGDRLVQENTDLTLELPTGKKARLVLGNSVYGYHAWEGDIYGLAFYRSVLTDRDIAAHFSRWSQERHFSFAKNGIPFVLYVFDEKEGRWAFDHSGGHHHLNLPEKIKTWERKLLRSSWPGFEFNKNDMIDFSVNVLGFIPFGFFLAAVLAGMGGNLSKHSVLITVGSCLMISLCIEIVQAWLPSRNSSLSDLILNVFGGWTGSVIYKLVPLRT